MNSESRQRWLYFGNLGSGIIGLWGIGLGLQQLTASTYQGNGSGAALIMLATAVLCLSAWSLWDAGGFKHKTYDGKSGGQKTLYWVGAATGLTIGLPVVIGVAIPLVFLYFLMLAWLRS